MKWSWRIARVAGIGIYVHATFVLLLAWVALGGYQSGGSAAAAAVGVLFIAAVFFIVVLHELGHALAARHYGIATRDITLLPIGGVARLERMPREPRQELVVALAGPAVNVALAALIWLVLAVTGGTGPLPDISAPLGGLPGRAFLGRLLSVNVWLALFNLIPAFPMDGGRVLRALLAMRRSGYAQATETAARVGRFFALVFGVVGLFVVNNPFLVLVALFVWLGAAGEASAERQSSTLAGVPTGEVMITDVRTLAPGDPLSHAVRLILDGFQQDFPVVENGVVVGMLTRRDLMRSLSERGESSAVGAAMNRDFPVSAPEEPVEEVLARLKTCNCQALPVVRARRLLGVLTLENVGEFMMVRAALGGVSGRGERVI